MREIKFRIWDITEKEMIYPDLYWFEEEGVREVPGDAHGYQVMQFTGLQDKQGKDIYEGDIVRLYDERMPKEIRGQIVQVTFENGCFMFGGFYPYGLEGQEVEVIGNVWENDAPKHANI